MTSDEPLVVTGIGLIASIGNSREEVARNLFAGNTGIERFDFGWAEFSTIKLAGTIKGFQFPHPNWGTWVFPPEYAIPASVLRNSPPHGTFAYCALSQVLEETGLEAGSPELEGAGLYCASAGSPFMARHYLLPMIENKGKRAAPGLINSTIAGTLNINLGPWLGNRGANAGFVSSCTSSAHALGYAMEDLRLGRVDRAFVVAAEDLFPENILPFLSFRVLSTAEDPRSCRPFDAARMGFAVTGGAVAFQVERISQAEKRGLRPYCRIAGWGQSADGMEISMSDPSGRGLAKAMQAALAAAGWEADSVDYVNAHATGTLAGDRSEATALEKVFGPSGARPPVSSTKAITGHGLGMTSLLEAAFCCLAFRLGKIPGNPNLREPDPACAGLNLPRESVEMQPRRILNNSSAFGGSHTCFAFEAV